MIRAHVGFFANSTKTIFREFMAALTVNFSPVDFARRVASGYVHFFGHGLEMARLHAKTVFAKMIDFKTFRDRAFSEFIGKSMSKYRFSLGSKPAVSFHSGCGPYPTMLRDLNLVAKSNFNFFHGGALKYPSGEVNAL